MITFINVEMVIYAYMAASFSLAIYNFFFIFISNVKKRVNKRKITKWRECVMEALQTEDTAAGRLSPEHETLLRELAKPGELICYSRALDLIENEQPGATHRYINCCYFAFLYLAVKYKKKKSMERAYFADFLSRYTPCKGVYRPILDVIISYLDGSTIYCRENVLRALFAFGNAEAVVMAMDILSGRRLFHHQKLIADGMLAFNGDKDALAAQLWRASERYAPHITLAIVQFITAFSPAYTKEFLPVLENQQEDIEVRLAIIRYYRKYPYDEARDVLLYFLTHEQEDERLSIIAAQALSGYTGDGIKQALKKALSSRNWHVRFNAAAALVKAGLKQPEIEEILNAKDRYAKEILTYQLEHI